MWICSKDGFYSAVVVRNSNPERLQVRARDKAHLDRLLARMRLPNRQVRHTPDHDYAWRIYVSRLEWRKIATALAGDVDYDNFKGAVDRQESGSWYARALHQVWGVLERAAREPWPDDPPSLFGPDGPSLFDEDGNVGATVCAECGGDVAVPAARGGCSCDRLEI